MKNLLKSAPESSVKFIYMSPPETPGGEEDSTKKSNEQILKELNEKGQGVDPDKLMEGFDVNKARANHDSAEIRKKKAFEALPETERLSIIQQAKTQSDKNIERYENLLERAKKLPDSVKKLFGESYRVDLFDEGIRERIQSIQDSYNEENPIQSNGYELKGDAISFNGEVNGFEGMVENWEADAGLETDIKNLQE